MLKIDNIPNNVILNNQYQNQKTVNKKHISSNLGVQNLDNQLQQMASVSKSQISFGKKEKLSKRDNIMIDRISYDFELDLQERNSLVKTLSSFLASKKLKSLDKVDNSEDVKPLYKNFLKVLKLDNNQQSKLNDYIKLQIETRATLGENYTESDAISLVEYLDDKGLFEDVFNENINNSIAGVSDSNYFESYLLEQEKDKSFIASIVHTFNLSEEQSYKFIDKTLNLLEKTNSDLISEIFIKDYNEILDISGDKNIAEKYEKQNKRANKLYQQYLSSIKKDFSLSERDIELFDKEFDNRINSDSVFVATIHPFDRVSKSSDKDIQLVNRIIRRYMSDDTACKSFIYNLKEDAFMNNVDSVFDLFNSNYGIPHLGTYLEHSVFDNVRDDIIRDMYEVGQNPKTFSNKLEIMDSHHRNLFNFANSIAEENELSDDELKMLLFNYTRYINQQARNDDNNLVN